MSSPTAFRIIIVGGGIAGLSAAIALRDPGREIIVLEQSSLHAEIGATISLQPNASRILKETWKLGEILPTAKGMVDKGFSIYNTEGKLVNRIPLLAKTEYGGDRMMYHRQDLHDCLKRATTSTARSGPPAIIRVASRVVAVDCDSASVTLDSGEVVQGDVVIAADGIRSAIREAVTGKVDPVPTGLSAYRFMVPSDTLEKEAPEFCEKIDPRAPFTSMVFAHSCRLVMGPAREGSVYSVVGLVPDEKMNEDPDSKQTWVSRGDRNKALETYSEFPEWIKAPFKQAKDIGLWQLRDLDPLPTLPTQGQGASQAIEDAEALGAFLSTAEEVPSALQKVFKVRYTRATLIQKYSREAAKPATDKGSSEIKMQVLRHRRC